MLKNLKRKFVITNMLLVGIVLLVVFISLCVNVYNNQMREVERTLEAPLSSEMDAKGRFGFLTSMVVLVDENNNVTETVVRGASMTDENLSYAVEKVMKADENNGKIGKLKLFYEKQKVSDGSTIVTFVDASRIDSIMYEIIVASGISFIFAMVIVYFISMFIAGIAIKPVQKSWEQQKQFVADASHELKTPLTVILANNDILKSKKDATIEEESQWIDSTVEEAKHMKNLVEGMLFLAKNDAMVVKATKSTINLSELAENDILQFEPVAYEEGVMLESDISSGVEIIADGTQMKQLMHILIDNAIKYSGGVDEPKVFVSIKNGNKKEIIVKNTCHKISRESLEHIFDRFYKGDESRTRIDDSQGGYGLGLAIAKTIVENNEGAITVKSDETIGPDGREGIEFKVVF